jgi:hypothetical protein
MVTGINIAATVLYKSRLTLILAVIGLDVTQVSSVDVGVTVIL